MKSERSVIMHEGVTPHEQIYFILRRKGPQTISEMSRDLLMSKEKVEAEIERMKIDKMVVDEVGESGIVKWRIRTAEVI